MKTTILSSPEGETFVNPSNPELFFRLTTAELVRLRAAYKPSEIAVYCYIKTLDPFGHGFKFIPNQVARELSYVSRTVTRAMKALVKAGELGLAIVSAHVRIVHPSLAQSSSQIISNLGLVNIPNPETVEQPIATPVIETIIKPIPAPEPSIPVFIEPIPTPEPSIPVFVEPIPAPEPPIPISIVEPIPTPVSAPGTQSTTKSGASSVGDIIEKLDLSQPTATIDDELKTRQWYAQIEVRLNEMDVQLKDVLHALKKYPVRAIEDGIAYVQKQKWPENKAGVLVNFLKKWSPSQAPTQQSSATNYRSYTKSKSTAPKVKNFLMSVYPENNASVICLEHNPIDEETYYYLDRLTNAGLIYGTHYTTVHNFFGVFLVKKDYPCPIPWWEAVPQLRQLYPDFK